MVYNQRTTRTIMFGGVTGRDIGTKQPYDLPETWEWTGTQWIERNPAQSPPGRRSFAMVYDSNRDQVLIFGGSAGITSPVEIDTTWVYKDGNWTQITPATSPSPREFPSAAYDPVHDRTVVFGGQKTVTTLGNTVVTPFYDTWEFDGTNWNQVSSAGPQVQKPILVYDAARKQVLMLGVDVNLATLMYAYDGDAKSWTKLTPTTLPACVNEAAATFVSSNSTVLVVGGVCTTSTVSEQTYQWDGTDWTLLTTTGHPGNLSGQAMSYDAQNDQALIFGGTAAFSSIQNTMWSFNNGDWTQITDTSVPAGRSLFVFRADPVNNVIWMFGGLNDANTFNDFWQYQFGQWTPITATGTPPVCGTPAAAWDIDRSKLVVVCQAGDTNEWDGTTWTKPAPKNNPGTRRFSAMVYDPTLRKTVLYGGFDDSNTTCCYRNETWLWDATNWTRITKNPAPARSNTSMWYDPILKRTVLYGGVGRPTSLDAIVYYDDMWSFDGSQWTQIKLTSGPGARYGAQVVVDPSTGHAILFGGLRVDTNGLTRTEVYSNDAFEWDGTSWKQLTQTNVPPARENAAFEWDPSTNQLVLFAGYAGHYLSDTWIYKGQGTWQQRSDTRSRRRTAGQGTATSPTAVPGTRSKE